MSLGAYKIKLRRNKDAGKGFYQYSLTYKKGTGHTSQVSYDILSAIAGDSDLLIELNTDLFYGVSPEPDKYAEKFLKDVQSLNLEYISRKVPSQYPVTVLGVTIRRRDNMQAYEIAAYVPNVIWKNASFKDVLPACGARYYIARETMDAKAVVNNLPDLSEEQKISMFRLVVFHMAELERFGIVSASDSEELLGLLGLR